jgi:hypothetical protein
MSTPRFLVSGLPCPPPGRRPSSEFENFGDCDAPVKRMDHRRAIGMLVGILEDRAAELTRGAAAEPADAGVARSVHGARAPQTRVRSRAKAPAASREAEDSSAVLSVEQPGSPRSACRCMSWERGTAGCSAARMQRDF